MLARQDAVNLEACPACGSNLVGPDIPESVRSYYGGRERFSRMIEVVDRRDCAVAFRCPDCRTEFPRSIGEIIVAMEVDRDTQASAPEPARPRSFLTPSRTILIGAVVGVLTVLGIRLAIGEELPVRQLWVIDGDTIDVLVPRKERIRLEAIDAPETAEPHCDAERRAGLEAKRAAISIVRAGRTASVTRGQPDRYGRTLGRIAIDGRDIGEELVARKLALPYRPGSAAKAERIAHWCGPGAW